MSDRVARAPVKTGALETRGSATEHNGKWGKFQEEPDGAAGMEPGALLTPGLSAYKDPVSYTHLTLPTICSV